jgi:hypothetical protein
MRLGLLTWNFLLLNDWLLFGWYIYINHLGILLYLIYSEDRLWLSIVLHTSVCSSIS